MDHGQWTIDMLPDWQLPPGVDRGLWDYLHSEKMVGSYDDNLASSPLLQVDLRFCEKQFIDRRAEPHMGPGALIDLGCGTGRLLIPFAKRGFDCLGVDLSEAMLAVAAAKVQREGVTVSLQKENLVELDAIASASFDYAACLFSTLGMIRGIDNRRKFLAHVRRILKPGGVFILHVHNRWFRLGFGLGKKGKEPGDRTMPQAYGGAELTLHHFSRREIAHELNRAGFTIREYKPVGIAGELTWPWWLPAMRAYGYLIASSA